MFLSDVLPASIAWHPDSGDLVLLGVALDDLAVAETILATLPPKARGQVFVEARPRPTPPGRRPGSRLRDVAAARARQSLTTSLEAWLAEMLPVEFDREHRVYAWFSGEASARALVS